MRLHVLGIMAIVALSLGTMTTPSAVRGQEDEKKPVADKTKETPKKELKDPTVPTPKLKAALLPYKDKDVIPPIAILAKVIGAGRDGSVLLRVGEQEILATKNSLIRLPRATLRVVSITSDQVTLEVDYETTDSRPIILK
jgi:hypothetical protein